MGIARMTKRTTNGAPRVPETPQWSTSQSPTRRKGAAAGVLYVDDDLLIVDKLPGVFLSGASRDQPEVLRFLIEAGIVRKDDALIALYEPAAAISGAAIWARSESVSVGLARQIDSRNLQITCLALVRCRVGEKEGVIDAPVAGKGRGPLRIDAQSGQPATTHWHLRDAFVGAAELECIPSSADPEQVRVHLKHVGMPLLVDPLYGGGRSLMLSSFKTDYRPSARRPERPLIDRVSLHVQRVTLLQPTTGTPLSIEAPPPKDYRAAQHQLDRFGRLPHVTK